jgi:FtsZ-interacting cell division protein ZipA
VPLLPTTYIGENSDPSPGTVVGIVLGSVLGFVLIVWLIFWALWSQSGGFLVRGAATTVELRRDRSPRRARRPEVTEVRRVSRSSLSPRRRSFSPHRRSRTEIVEQRVVEERIPVVESVRRVVSPSRDGSIVEKPRSRRKSRSRSRSRAREEEVIVYDDESTEFSSLPEPRRSDRRRSSGYRAVDPDRYAGGDYPRRSVSRRYS